MNAVNMVAFADVDDALASDTYTKHPDVPRFRDFRKMLDRHDKDIDAVVISTPDHTHHYIAKWCMQMGKHVYLEKPLAHSIMECRDLAVLEKKTGLVCQMGNQGHSGSGIALLEAWYKAGVLKWYAGSAFGPERPAQLEVGRKLGSNGGGTLIIGTKATVMMDSHAKNPRIIPESQSKELEAELPRVDKRGDQFTNHFTNWILSCKGEETPRSHFEYSARLTEAIHYGNIALHVNRDLKIDPVKRKILRDSEATQLMSGPTPREGWKL